MGPMRCPQSKGSLKMYIKRDGDNDEVYEVVEETDTDYAVLVEFTFFNKQCKLEKKKLKLWWDKSICQKVT